MHFLYTNLNTLNFPEKALVGGKMQPLKNAFELTYHPARMRPRLHVMSRERVRAYARCCENATALHAPFFLDVSGPTVLGQVTFIGLPVHDCLSPVDCAG